MGGRRAEGLCVWECPPGQGLTKFDFGSQIGEFWCKLGAFCTVHLKLV